MSQFETEAPPADIFVCGHFHEQYGYAVHRSHGSGNWLVTYTLAGQGLYRQHDATIRADPGDIILLAPHTCHDYSVPPAGLWDFLWAHFQPRADWLRWWGLPELYPGFFKASISALPNRERIAQTFMRLNADMNTFLFEQEQDQRASLLAGTQGVSYASDDPPTLLRRELALNRLEELFLVAALDARQAQERTIDPRVLHVLRRLAEDLRAPHTLETLAQDVALSPSRLAHLFKQEVGDSLINTLLTLRLKQAARLLTFTNDSIETIAEMVGFHSPFYFSRQFSLRFGCSPREYRKLKDQHS